MEYFLLEHPSNETVLCDRPNCGRVADYLEVEGDREFQVCAYHTTSEKYVSRLPKRSPDPERSYRARAAA